MVISGDFKLRDIHGTNVKGNKVVIREDGEQSIYIDGEALRFRVREGWSNYKERLYVSGLQIDNYVYESIYVNRLAWRRLLSVLIMRKLERLFPLLDGIRIDWNFVKIQNNFTIVIHGITMMGIIKLYIPEVDMYQLKVVTNHSAALQRQKEEIKYRVADILLALFGGNIVEEQEEFQD